MKDVEIFGVDPLTALEQAAKKTPLDIFKDFFGGYASTVIIGGDIGHFLERKAEDIFKTRALRVKAAAERLGNAAGNFHHRNGHDVAVLLHTFRCKQHSEWSQLKRRLSHTQVFSCTLTFLRQCCQCCSFTWPIACSPKHPCGHASLQSLRHLQRNSDSRIPIAYQLHGSNPTTSIHNSQAMGVDLPVALAVACS